MIILTYNMQLYVSVCTYKLTNVHTNIFV